MIKSMTEKHMPRKNLLSSRGFTLVELLIVIVMLGILLTAFIAAFNPLAQYNKAKDGQREHDLGQMQRALDSYFNDNKCYPTSLNFGQNWSVNGQVYMEKIPQDPDCASNSTKCYLYEADQTSACPQWEVLYAALRGPSITATSCPLVTRSNSSMCLPNGFQTNNYNFCLVSGNVDCSAVSAYVINSGGNGGGSGGSGGGGNATPTPTSGELFCPNDQYFACTGDNRCNSISPKTQCIGSGGTDQCYCDRHCNQSCAFN